MYCRSELLITSHFSFISLSSFWNFYGPTRIQSCIVRVKHHIKVAADCCGAELAVFPNMCSRYDHSVRAPSLVINSVAEYIPYGVHTLSLIHI